LTDVALVGLAVADPPERWVALGFEVSDGQTAAGSVSLTLGIAPQGGGITGWTLTGPGGDGDVAGLPTRWVPRGGPVAQMGPGGGGAYVVDHVVLVTPEFDALAGVLDERGMGLRRVTEIRGTRMGFRRLGGPILEVVEARDAERTAFWGVTFATAGPEALDELSAGNRLVGEVRPAVQPGRRIAAVCAEAGLSTRVAFIDPELR
jgi:hypothetical protein